MTGLPWMEIARAEIGVKEFDGPADNPRIISYHEHTTLKSKEDETPWCAAFCNWVLDQVNLPTLHHANARSFLELPTRCGPRHGAIAILWRGSKIGSQGHVGFVESFDENTVTLLGGNQGDAVSVAKFPRSRVLAFRWPDPATAPAAPGT